MTKYYKLPCEFQNIKNKCLHPPPLKNLREKFRKKQKKNNFRPAYGKLRFSSDTEWPLKRSTKKVWVRAFFGELENLRFSRPVIVAVNWLSSYFRHPSQSNGYTYEQIMFHEELGFD